MYLIWSNEHRAWWKANSLGYTTDIREAGVYGEGTADAVCEGATMDWTSSPNEIPVLVESLPKSARDLIADELKF